MKKGTENRHRKVNVTQKEKTGMDVVVRGIRLGKLLGKTKKTGNAGDEENIRRKSRGRIN